MVLYLHLQKELGGSVAGRLRELGGIERQLGYPGLLNMRTGVKHVLGNLECRWREETMSDAPLVSPMARDQLNGQSRLG